MTEKIVAHQAQQLVWQSTAVPIVARPTTTRQPKKHVRQKQCKEVDCGMRASTMQTKPTT